MTWDQDGNPKVTCRQYMTSSPVRVRNIKAVWLNQQAWEQVHPEAKPQSKTNVANFGAFNQEVDPNTEWDEVPEDLDFDQVEMFAFRPTDLA